MSVADPVRRFLAARRFDPDGALKQFQEASKFREEKHITRLYDMVNIADFEQARQLVSYGPLCQDQPPLMCPSSIPIGQGVEIKRALRFIFSILTILIKMPLHGGKRHANMLRGITLRPKHNRQFPTCYSWPRCIMKA